MTYTQAWAEGFWCGARLYAGPADKFRADWDRFAKRCKEEKMSIQFDSVMEMTDDRDFWKGVAAQHLKNEEYYRGLLDQIGEAIGDDALIADDGSRPGGVIRAKLPDLVRKIVSR